MSDRDLQQAIYASLQSNRPSGGGGMPSGAPDPEMLKKLGGQLPGSFPGGMPTGAPNLQDFLKGKKK